MWIYNLQVDQSKLTIPVSFISNMQNLPIHKEQFNLNLFNEFFALAI